MKSKSKLLLAFIFCFFLLAGMPLNLHAQYYIAANGNDSWSGKLAEPNKSNTDGPFATLENARDAMRASSVKTAFVRAGVYTRFKNFTLTVEDNGETWSYYSPDGVNTAILDGGDTLRGPMILCTGSNITINGIRVQHFWDYGIRIIGSSSAPATGNTVMNCDVGYNNFISWETAAISGYKWIPHLTIKNNYVHHTTSQGIDVHDNWGGRGETGDVDHLLIENNVVLWAVQKRADGGGIYIELNGGFLATDIKVRNNFVRDIGTSVIWEAHDIYLDEGTNHAVVTGNVCGPMPFNVGITSNPPSHAESIFCINHGKVRANNNIITGNMVDLGASRVTSIAIWQDSAAYGSDNNIFTNNIIISRFTGNQKTRSQSELTGYSYFQDRGTGPKSNLNISNNIYHNYGGGQERTDGNGVSDTNPIHTDPLICDWIYNIDKDSPAFKSPVNFTPIAGGWGPPGFVIPHYGTPPSCPISCEKVK